MILRNRFNQIIFFTILFVFGTIVFSYFMGTTGNRVKGEEMAKKKRIFLMGASVGKEWNLPEFPERAKVNSVIFESAAIYQFDKSAALEELLIRPKRKFHLTRTYLRGFFQPAPRLPDLIILKECAAYFPGEMELYKSLVKGWVNRIRGSNIEVALATVVPITKARAEKEKEKISAIREYNDWVRAFSKKEHITLLDLESALRTDGEARYLREEYSSGDGLHLNKRAYDILDHLLRSTFEIRS